MKPDKGNTMINSTLKLLSGFCTLVMVVGWTATAAAQAAEVKEKPPLYTYEASWVMPRANWPEMEKAAATNQKILEHDVAAGGLVGFGSDATVLHSADGATHDNWWSGTSIASVLNALDEVMKASGGAPSVLASATKHWDNLYVSRYYNWHPGSWKGAYTRWSGYSLKADAPNDAVEILAKSFFVPLLEKLLADGTIVEYEIDTESVHTSDPGSFGLAIITPNAEGLDKVGAAISEAVRKAPMSGPTLNAFVDLTKHRDVLVRSTATYK
jgi:hypothetical protein